MASEISKANVLLVDDEPALLRGYSRWLKAAGYRVATAEDGEQAVRLLDHDDFDVVVSDITMPGMGGVGLLRVARERGLDLPFVMVTGSPTLDTAIPALEHGALRYLSKPVDPGELERAVEGAAMRNRASRVQREALAVVAESDRISRALVAEGEGLDRALGQMWMAWQPIVLWSERRTFSFEALMRTDDRTFPHPGAVLDAAERTGRLGDVGRTVRRLVAAEAACAPPDALLFVNLHSRDLLDDALYSADAPLSRIAHRVVLEITERAAVSEIKELRARVAALRGMGFRMAIDDLGAGFAGLSSIAQLEPDVVKLDMSLVRGIHESTTKRKLVASMTTLCREMGLLVVAEGVETREERDTLVDVGCDLFQGYFFAKPAKAFPAALLAD